MLKTAGRNIAAVVPLSRSWSRSGGIHSHCTATEHLNPGRCYIETDFQAMVLMSFYEAYAFAVVIGGTVPMHDQTSPSDSRVDRLQYIGHRYAPLDYHSLAASLFPLAWLTSIGIIKAIWVAVARQTCSSLQPSIISPSPIFVGAVQTST